MGQTVLILGAGFGGLPIALKLADEFRGHPDPPRIVLVDKEPYHLFKPMLAEVATGCASPHQITEPLGFVLRGRRVELIQGRVLGIDLAARRVEVRLAGGPWERTPDQPQRTLALAYDRLVLALGSSVNFFRIEGAREHCVPLNDIRDAERIRAQMMGAFAMGTRLEDPVQRRKLLSFVVIGGGPTGVELVAEIHNLVHHTLVPSYPLVDYAREVSVRVIEAGPTLMPGTTEVVRNSVIKHLLAKDIAITAGKRVTRVGADFVELEDGKERIEAANLFWSAGVRGNEAYDALPLAKGRTGRVVVEPTLLVPGHPEVIAVGDGAEFLYEGRPLPTTAQVAVQEAAAAAWNLARLLRGDGTLRPFRYKHMGTAVSLGDEKGVFMAGARVTLEGFLGWFGWKLIYLKHLASIRGSFRAALKWMSDLTYDREASRHLYSSGYEG